MIEGKYQDFYIISYQEKNRKTLTYRLHYHNNKQLGLFRWDNTWQKHCFVPNVEINLIIDPNCLIKICELLCRVNGVT